ncbi:MAG: hypothetical protein ACOVP4_12990 [Bacteriovoracaceae bacterium]|jgi:hypothetical protein
MKNLIVGLAILSASPAVLAQSYGGTVSDLNTIFEPPMNINGTICDQYTNTGNEHAYKACSDGVGASRWMAEKYAQNAGKYLGCLDGYYQGIYDGFYAGVNPTQEMIKQAEAFVKGANFDTATSRATQRAQAEGQTESADQIIKRYRAVLGLRDSRGNPVLPNKDYSYPRITFNGFEDGYENDVARLNAGYDFNPVYTAGWVKPTDRFDDRIAARRGLLLQQEYAKSLCDVNQTIFGRNNMPAVTIWDFFKARREYNFQNYGWKSPDLAWQVFDRDERTLEQYQTFTRLRGLEKTETVTIPIKETRFKLDASGNPIKKLDANGIPVVGADGRPVFETEEIITGYRNETRRVKLSDAEVKELENIYVNGFKVAYDRFYAKQYASKAYNSEGLERYATAKIIGRLMGEDVANQTARREAYNKQYQIQSAKKYAEVVKKMYEDSFNRLMNIFETNPVVELNSAELIGSTDDNIFRAGEELRVQFSVSNLGEVSRPTTLIFDNTADVIANSQGFVFSAPALDRKNYVSNILGAISSDKFAQQEISLGMNLVNPGNLAEVARPLIVRKNERILLNDYAEVKRINGNLNYLTGDLNLVVDLENPASVTAPSTAQVELFIDGAGKALDKDIEPIAAQSLRSVSLTTNKLDPLDVIAKGKITGVVNVKMAGRTIHRKAFEIRVADAPSMAIVRYFDGLATGEISNSGNESRQDRLAKLGSMIEDSVVESIRGRMKWTKPNEVARTAVAELQKVYAESKRQGTMNAEAQRNYDDLASTLAKHSATLKARGILNDRKNRKVYLKELAKISPKLNVNWKSYR